VTIVYQDDAIQPENRDAIKKIKDSGAFERMADRLTKAVALPHDLLVVITDKLPNGIDDPTTELDGRRIFWPAAFLKQTYDALTEFLPEVVRDKGAPTAIAQESFTADVLNVWGNQFILGHELGHAVIHQLELPLTGLEEDFADGFATFFTVNDKDTGPNAALAAAVLFDAMGSKRPNLTLEDFSSDHAVILQRATTSSAPPSAAIRSVSPHSSPTATSQSPAPCCAARNGRSSTMAGGRSSSRISPRATRRRPRRYAGRLA